MEKFDINIGLVSGIITSDGPEYTESNMRKIIDYTSALRRIYNFIIFSTMDVFPHEARKRLNLQNVSYQEFVNFWREALELRCITDIFLTPRWDKSNGARDEYKTAKKIGINIHYITENILLK